MGCKSPPLAAPFDVETHEMELGSGLEATEEGAAQEKATTAMDQGSQGKTQGNDQEMTTEEQEVTSLKAAATVMTH